MQGRAGASECHTSASTSGGAYRWREHAELEGLLGHFHERFDMKGRKSSGCEGEPRPDQEAPTVVTEVSSGQTRERRRRLWSEGVATMGEWGTGREM